MSGAEMSEQENQINNIIGYIVILLVVFFAISKGTEWWTKYSIIKDYDERIEFALKNNSEDKCATISNAIGMANTVVDQKALDRYKAIKQSNCNEY